MTAEVRAWARERLARTLAGMQTETVGDVTRLKDEVGRYDAVGALSNHSAGQFADAVLAVLPELLSDERVVEAVGDTLALHQGVTPGRLARLAQATVADVLAGEQP